MKLNKVFRDKLSVAWLLFVLSLLLHIIDEAVNNFLDFFNPMVLKIKEQISFIPLPVFTFNLWISGLILAIIILLLITFFVYNRTRFLFPLIKIFATLMIINGLAHIIGSVYFDKILPGFISSPILIAFAVYFIYNVQQRFKSKSTNITTK
jgi:hypothetical protein